MMIAAPSANAQQVDRGIIRLGAPAAAATETEPADSPFGDARRGFDFESFDARLETLWFQRKALLRDGRTADAARQAERIRAFCLEEGVQRLEYATGALLAEANRALTEGQYERAMEALDLASVLDPGRPQVAFGSARVYAKSGRGYVKAAGFFFRGLGSALLRQVAGLQFANRALIACVLAALGAVAVFSLLMLYRYQVPLRHEIHEWLQVRELGHWSLPAGWGALLLPFLTWIAAGWAAVYWLVLTFRYQRRNERVTSVALLLLTILSVPAYRFSVAAYGVTTDPVVRTTLASAEGGYDPGRIVQIKELVGQHPDDPTYRFLLANQYKAGRYYEEAFDEYRAALQVRPSMYQAHINIGNIYQRLGQHEEAIRHYRSALDIKGDSVLAYVNLHLAQSASFHFKEAEESLVAARSLDAGRTTRLMADAAGGSESVQVIDAAIDSGSVWQAALDGDRLREGMQLDDRRSAGVSVWRLFLNPVTWVAGVSLVAALAIGFGGAGSTPARRCIRCTRPFCRRCKADRDSKEYCSQCHHLFVLGEGLAADTKTRKLYEVERAERWSKLIRRGISLPLPGAGYVLAGRPLRGALLLIAWIAAWVLWRPEVLLPIERWVDLDLRLDLLGAGAVPAAFSLDPSALLALLALLAVWTAGNLGRKMRVA